MHDKADGIVDSWIVRKGTVSTFVCNHPDSSRKGATEEPVQWPKDTPSNNKRNKGMVNPSAHVNKNGNHCQVIKEISKGTHERATETMRRDGFLDVRERKGRLIAWSSRWLHLCLAIRDGSQSDVTVAG